MAEQRAHAVSNSELAQAIERAAWLTQQHKSEPQIAGRMLSHMGFLLDEQLKRARAPLTDENGVKP